MADLDARLKIGGGHGARLLLLFAVFITFILTAQAAMAAGPDDIFRPGEALVGGVPRMVAIVIDQDL